MQTLEIKHSEVIDGVPTYFGRFRTEGYGYDFIAAIVGDDDGKLDTLIRTASFASPGERSAISRVVLALWRSARREAHVASQQYFDDCYSG